MHKALKDEERYAALERCLHPVAQLVWLSGS